MTRQNSFEDTFDHDEHFDFSEQDLDTDNENPDTNTAFDPEKYRIPRKGCLSNFFKIALSLGLITGVCFYIFHPAQIRDIKSKITKLRYFEKDDKAPLLTIGSPDLMISAQKLSEQNQPLPSVILRGSGSLADFNVLAEKKLTLNAHLRKAEKINFSNLDQYHDIVKALIFDWTQETDPKKIEPKTAMPYQKFFMKTSATLFSQTVLKQAGLTSVDNSQLILQPPVQIMAVLYPLVRQSMDKKVNIQEKLKILEPVSSFLIYICHGNSECLSSWDLFINMLGAGNYAKVLATNPEALYNH